MLGGTSLADLLSRSKRVILDVDEVLGKSIRGQERIGLFDYSSHCPEPEGNREGNREGKQGTPKLVLTRIVDSVGWGVRLDRNGVGFG